MSQWVRPLDQSTKAAAEWHVPRTKSFTTTTYCGKNLAGPIEVASDDKAEREGRCRQCRTSLGPTREGSVPQRRARPTPQKQMSPVAKRAVRPSRRPKA